MNIMIQNYHYNKKLLQYRSVQLLAASQIFSNVAEIIITCIESVCCLTIQP